FPSNPSTIIAKRLGQFVKDGGRKVVVSDGDWRAMRLMRDFTAQHGADPGFERWLADAKPLSHLKSLRDALDLEGLHRVDADAKLEGNGRQVKAERPAPLPSVSTQAAPATMVAPVGAGEPT